MANYSNPPTAQVTMTVPAGYPAPQPGYAPPPVGYVQQPTGQIYMEAPQVSAQYYGNPYPPAPGQPIQVVMVNPGNAPLMDPVSMREADLRRREYSLQRKEEEQAASDAACCACCAALCCAAAVASALDNGPSRQSSGY